MYSTVEVSLHSQGGWRFEIVFWMIWVLITRLYLTFIRRKLLWQFDIRSNVTQDFGDTRLFKDIHFADLIKTWCNDIYFANDCDCSLSLSADSFRF